MVPSMRVTFCIIVPSTAALQVQGRTNVQTAQDAAAALHPIAGPLASTLFSAGLIGTGLLAIPILSASASYALKEFLGLRGSLAAKPRSGPAFYAVIIVSTAVGAAINFGGIDPIKALFLTAVINGLVAPPLLILIVLLGSDHAVMGRRASGIWSRVLTWSATAGMAAE